MFYFFSSLTTDFNISLALRWAIQDQWSSGIFCLKNLEMTYATKKELDRCRYLASRASCLQNDDINTILAMPWENNCSWVGQFKSYLSQTLEDRFSYDMSQLMRLWYLSHRRPAKAQATSEGSGEPAHLRSLTRSFAVRTHKIWK